jgi:hypothetical protein
MRPPVLTPNNKQHHRLICFPKKNSYYKIILICILLLGTFIINFIWIKQYLSINQLKNEVKLMSNNNNNPTSATTTTTTTDNLSNSSTFPVLFVLGMHHSMTSIATKLFLDVGLWAGDKQELIIRKDNPYKYFEHYKIVQSDQDYFNRMLLPSSNNNNNNNHLFNKFHRVGTNNNINNHPSTTTTTTRHSPHDWLGYNLPLTSTNSDEELEKDAETIMKELIDRANTKKVALIVKDPRMSLVADPWLRAAVKFSQQVPICIILVRDPEETSIRFLDYNTVRDQLSGKEWYSVWEQYTFRAFLSCEKIKATIHVIRNDDLAREPQRVMETLIHKLGTRVFSDPSAAIKKLSTLQSVLLPPDFTSKHEQRYKIWNEIKSKIVPKDLVSEQGKQLWDQVMNHVDHQVTLFHPYEKFSMPNWISLNPPLPHPQLLSQPTRGNNIIGNGIFSPVDYQKQGVVISIKNYEDLNSAIALIRSFHIHDTTRKFIAMVDNTFFTNRPELTNAGWRLVYDKSPSSPPLVPPLGGLHSRFSPTAITTTTTTMSSNGIPPLPTINNIRQILGLETMLYVSLNCIVVGDWTKLFPSLSNHPVFSSRPVISPPQQQQQQQQQKVLKQGTCEAILFTPTTNIPGNTDNTANPKNLFPPAAAAADDEIFMDATNGIGKSIRDGMLILSGRTKDMKT